MRTFTAFLLLIFAAVISADGRTHGERELIKRTALNYAEGGYEVNAEVGG